MVIQTNELEFKGKTIQEYLEWKYPAQEDKEEVELIDVWEINRIRKEVGIMEKLEGGELDLKGFKNLWSVSVDRDYLKTPLTKLNLDGLTNLTSLGCSNNNLTSLDLREFKKLTSLGCSNNNLTSLDLREFKKLTLLHCSNNKLTSLDISKNVNLTELYCHYNILTSLNIKDLTNLTFLNCSFNNLTSLNIKDLTNLTYLNCANNNLTSVDFLNQLPNPEKLTALNLGNNNIERTNLEFLRPFINLEQRLALGTDKPEKYKNNIYNRFYGSLEPLRNMTKLLGLCINGTDVEEGIEYLPVSISKNSFNCFPKLPNQKVAKIQNELRPFNYDLEAWQLAHPEKTFKASPELSFINEGNRDRWLQLLKNKLEESKKELSETEREKAKRIVRLESKIQELTQAKTQISQQTQTEFSTQDKSIQTDLSMGQIEKWEKEDKKKTLYQKFIEKYGKK